MGRFSEVTPAETLSGEALSAMLDETGHLDSGEIAHLGLQLYTALAYLHSQEVAHLDLKPSNIIGQAGRSRLIDLGPARPFGDGRPGVGTWSYMAPEQTTGVGLGPATDVWGLGASLFPGSRLTLRGLAAGLEDVLEVPDSARHHSGSIPS